MDLPVRNFDLGKDTSSVRWSAVLTVDPDELWHAVRDGWHVDAIEGWNVRPQLDAGQVLFLPKPNLVVNSGINRRLDREFAINGPPAAVDSIGVDDGTANPSATTSQSADGNSANRTIIAMSPGATRASQVISFGGTFTNSNVGWMAAAHPIKRLFANASTTDASGNLHSMTNVFTWDFSPFTTWSQAVTGQVTGTGS